MMRVLLLVLLSSVPSLSTIFRLREKTLTAGKKRDHVARFFEKREEPSYWRALTHRHAQGKKYRGGLDW